MSLNIKSEDAHRLARELAQETHESMTRAVTVALQERLDRVRHDASIAARAQRILTLGRATAARLDDESRAIDHGELLYDEAGLPIVDTSALVAILRDEPEAEDFSIALAAATTVRLSAANYLETGIVIDSRRDEIASNNVDALIREAAIEITAVTATQARIARQAYRDFGKGSGHPAQLNFGDCFAYALASEAREPLLFKSFSGDDFGHTDLEPA
jgi:ribonuclease VapC